VAGIDVQAALAIARNHDLVTISELLPTAEPGVIETFNTNAE
jgi:hypothetical protein